jgi:tetratricopeptide (TPR) repeat protein
LLDFEVVRTHFIFLFCILSLGCTLAPAETVHLKNGRTIWAETVRENGNRIEYEVGENTFAIPKSLVDHIDRGGAPPEYSTGSGSSKSTEIAPPSTELRIANDVYAQVLHDGKVDTDTLAKLEREGTPDRAAAGYFLAGRHEIEQGNTTTARTYYESALRLQPENAILLAHYTVLLLRAGATREGLAAAEHAVRVAPDSADAYAVLGAAQYASDRTNEAIRSWKRSLALRADPNVERLLAKAQKDAATEESFTENQSSHFTLRFEGKQTSESLRRAILSTLESQYDELAQTLGSSPRDSVAIILYTNQAFFDVTQAPSWTGALNDGKMRIPVSGLDSLTPELARVLKHELAHSFINYISHGRCPQWLHEGIAQMVEPRSLNGRGQRLGQIFLSQRAIPFNMLEAGFLSLSSSEAAVAYDESLAAVEYIQETYGMSDVQRVLQRMAEGSTPEAALRATVHSGYRELEGEVGKFLAAKYGG